MHLFRLIALAIFFMLATNAAMARDPVPIVNYADVIITTGSGKTPTTDQLKQAFIAAGNARRWTFSDQGTNQLIGSLSWENHSLMVTISYTPQKYSVTYRDSINLKYGVDNGTPVIHPRYNTFVQELMTRVRMELSRF